MQTLENNFYVFERDVQIINQIELNGNLFCRCFLGILYPRCKKKITNTFPCIKTNHLVVSGCKFIPQRTTFQSFQHHVPLFRQDDSGSDGNPTPESSRPSSRGASPAMGHKKR